MEATSKKSKRGCLILVIGIPAGLFALLAVLAMIDMAIAPPRETVAGPVATPNTNTAPPDSAPPPDPALEPPPPKAPAKPGEIQALAVETLAFIDEAQKTIGYAIQAGDGQAVIDGVEMPSWRLMQRWNDYDIMDKYAYEACDDALSALHFYADKLTQPDSADRRRSMDYNATRLEKLLPKCRRTVDSKGRIRSDE